jgi:hypothetical protein
VEHVAGEEASSSLKAYTVVDAADKILKELTHES